jgi:cytochrome b6
MKTLSEPDETRLQRMSRSKAGLREWFADRYPIISLLEWARGKQVPQHRHAVWYYPGGMLLFMLAIQIVTGVMLAFYYRPTEDGAYKSILNISGVMPFGWVIRSLHAWTANVMIAVAFVHLFSVWLLRSFRKPRELTWVTGVLLLGLLLAFGFSGYLLPWDELAFFATKVGTKIIGSIPIFGYRLMTFLRGGEEVTGDTISRFYAFHTCVVPLLVCAIAGVHVLLVQIQGMSVPPSVDEKTCLIVPFFPDFLLHDMRLWLVLFGALVTVAVLVPWGIGQQANPLAPAPAGIRPEWYFLSMYEVLKLLPTRILGIEGEVVGTLGLLAAGLILLFLPFVLRRAESGRSAWACVVLAFATVLFLSSFTVVGYLSSEREKTGAMATAHPPVSQKAMDVQKDPVAKALSATRLKVEGERRRFLFYVLGLWVFIGFLAVVIHLRLVEGQRARRSGLT